MLVSGPISLFFGDGADDVEIGTASQDSYEELTKYLIAMVKDLYSIELV